MKTKLLSTFFLAVSLLFSMTSTSHAALQGDACVARDNGALAKYRCAEIGNGKIMTIGEIYRMGYRVVSVYPYDGNTLIVIEKQS